MQRVGDARGVRERVGARVHLGGRHARAVGYVALELGTNGREHTSDGVHLELVELVVLALAPCGRVWRRAARCSRSAARFP